MLAAVAGVIVATSAAWLVLRGDNDDATRAVSFVIDGVELAVDVPSGWRVRDTDNRLSLYKGAMFFTDDDGCGRADYEAVFVGVDGDLDTRVAAVPRPERFTPEMGTGVHAGGDDSVCDFRVQEVQFRYRDGEYRATLTFGRDAEPARVDEAYRVLDSLKRAD